MKLLEKALFSTGIIGGIAAVLSGCAPSTASPSATSIPAVQLQRLVSTPTTQPTPDIETTVQTRVQPTSVARQSVQIPVTPNPTPTLAPVPTPTLAPVPTSTPNSFALGLFEGVLQESRILYHTGVYAFSAKIDNSDLKRLVKGVRSRMSPDRNMIATTTDNYNGNWIMVHDIVGDAPAAKVGYCGVCEFYLTWSPDGKQVYVGRQEEISIYNTGAPGRLTLDARMILPEDIWGNTSRSKSIDLSHDGSKLAMSVNMHTFTNYDIFIYDRATDTYRRLTSDDSAELHPRWSPDGSKIAFVSDLKGNNDIYLIDVNTSVVLQLTFDKADDIEPTWSPDGRYIAFASNRSGNYDIHIMPTTGENDYSFNLTHSREDDRHPDWFR